MRRLSSRTLLVAATVALIIGGVTLYARVAVFDAEQFSDRATAALEDEHVRAAVSDKIVDELIAQGSAELIQARPLLEAAVAAALDTGAFQAIFERAARNVHLLLFTRERGSIVLDLADAGVVVISALRAIAPDVAKEVPEDVEGALIELSDRDFAARLLDVAEQVRFLGILLPLLAVALFLASALTAPDRRRHVVEAGAAVGIAGGIIAVGLIVAKAIVVGGVDGSEAQDAVGAAWESFLGDLRVLSLGAGALGLVFAATAASVIAPEEVEDWLDRARRTVTVQPEHRGWRLVRAMAVIALSLFVILRPTYAVQVAVVVLGGYGLYFGVREALEVLAPPRRGGLGSRDIDILPRISGRAVALAGMVVIALVVTVVAIVSDERPLVAAPAERADRPVTVCNGHAELCDRRVNEVVFAGTHNAMSAADRPGWYFAGHRGGIREQLDYGVRALLVDTHYGLRDDEGRVRTDLEREGTNRAKIVEAIGEEGLAAAERLVGRVGFGEAEGEPGLYMCHTLCELGATPLADGLAEVRQFLEANPDEFLILFVQDAVTPEDTAAAFEASGVLHWVYEHPRHQPWPTLRELIEEDERLLVMAEEQGGTTPAWYHDGFELTQDTPYVFHSVDELEARASCRPNRGTPSSPLFLVNHWIERVNPSPGLAREVNDFELLMHRGRLCRDMRELVPNILAVDFYDEGDLIEAVNVLNGLPRRGR